MRTSLAIASGTAMGAIADFSVNQLYFTYMSTTLTPGDIAIVGYITNGNPDSFSFVPLVPLTAGTVIYFTDNGWTGTAFRGSSATDGDGNENLIRFTARIKVPSN